jgi:predicted DNA-binding transcriptional regulator YafY
MQRLQRLLRMAEMINGGYHPTREDFCCEFECKSRTVDEDIRFLKEEMHLSIEFDRFHGGYINTNPKQKMPQFDLDHGELMALSLGKDMLSQYFGTTFRSILRSALDKINGRLPDHTRLNFKEQVSVACFKPNGIAPVRRKTFFDFSKACDQQTVMRINYFSAHNGRETSREIEPYHLVENRGAWYCIAWCRLRDELRLFALHRVNLYFLTQEKFSAREAFNLDSYLNAAFLLEHGDPPQIYIIKFDSTAARYIRERHWHPSQEITNYSDESCTLSFVATNMEEVKRWVLSYGAAAEVLKPVELRHMIQAELAGTIAVYQRACSQPEYCLEIGSPIR